MLELKIGTESYHICATWNDLTLGRADLLHRIEMPSCLRKIYETTFEPKLTPELRAQRVEELYSEITIDEHAKSIPSFYLRVIECLSDVPREVLLKTSVHSAVVLYQQYCQRFVEGVRFFPFDYSHREIRQFEFEGETYLLPVCREVFGDNVPMVDVTALEFAESADLMIHLSNMNEQRDIKRIGNIVSVLCRPKGEQYNEAVSLARAEKFLNLTMDVAWNVFFSLLTPLIILSQYDQICLLKQQIEETKEVTN